MKDQPCLRPLRMDLQMHCRAHMYGYTSGICPAKSTEHESVQRPKRPTMHACTGGTGCLRPDLLAVFGMACLLPDEANLVPRRATFVQLLHHNAFGCHDPHRPAVASAIVRSHFAFVPRFRSAVSCSCAADESQLPFRI